MIEQLPKHHIVTQITLETIGLVEVSTVDFRTHPFVNNHRYSETCLFWAFNENGISTKSHVVATYPTWAEAESRHNDWCQPERAAKAIVESRSRNI